MSGGVYILGGGVRWWVYFKWWWVVLCLFWVVVGDGGFILGGSGCILVGGGWYWVYFGWWGLVMVLLWVVVSGCGFILAGGGWWWVHFWWWWVVVGHGTVYNSLKKIFICGETRYYILYFWQIKKKSSEKIVNKYWWKNINALRRWSTKASKVGGKRSLFEICLVNILQRNSLTLEPDFLSS